MNVNPLQFYRTIPKSDYPRKISFRWKLCTKFWKFNIILNSIEMWKPVLFSIKNNFFILQIHIYCMYFCWSCEMHTCLRLLWCQWILYCLETICVCELRFDTHNISESLDGALFYLQALKSCEKATKPVFVSPGHKISIDSATELVHRCSKYRVPEPIRQVNPRPTDSVGL